MKHVIVSPNLQVAMFGWPATIELTAAEARAMAAVHLGGLEALRTPDYRCACRTVDSLIRKGLLAGNGPTEYGRHVAEACGRPSL